MKKLSIEEKAKAYDGAIKRAKGVIEQNPLMEYLKKGIEYIFPELKESEDEDEKIRKRIINALHGDVLGMEETYKAIAWLEKQGEQKPQGKTALEVINEEKVDNANKLDNTNKDELGFYIGDWVVTNNTKIVFLIKSYNSGYYTLEDIKGNTYSPCIAPTEEDYHLWSINDAKDGDVLNSPSHHLIWIYRDNEHYYACVNMNYVTENVATDGLIKIPSDACPATKEQREQLKKAMADAGYAFDFDKKKLKKIVAPKFKIGDTMRTSQEASNGITSGLPVIVSIDNKYYHCNNELIAIKNQDNYEYPPMNRRQKPAWSKEDELYIRELESLVKQVWATAEHKNDKGTIHKMSDLSFFLKTLKPQSTWKPSEEQMQALCSKLPLLTGSGNEVQRVLETLYCDLKKLRNE